MQRVGGNDEIEVDFRLVCATHQNIQARVDEGAFRADLFYRINVFPIQVPSLAERQVDIPLIAAAMIDHLAETGAGKSPELDESALTELSRYPWPGNVRELRNVLERAVVMFPDQTVSSTQVRENLLRMKAPDRAEEMSALWEASQDLMGIDIAAGFQRAAAAAPDALCRLVQLFRQHRPAPTSARHRGCADRSCAGKVRRHGQPGGRSPEAAPHDTDREDEKLMIERPSQAESSGTAAE